MTKNKPPYRYALRVLAGKLEVEALSQEEKNGLVKFLRDLAEGSTVSEALGIKNPAHRPQGCQLEQRIFDVAVLMLPEVHGGGGKTKAEAVAEVAKLHNKSENTIIEEYKSDRGKIIRASVKSNYFNPLAKE